MNVEGPGKCVNYTALNYSIRSFNILSDLPLPVITMFFLGNLETIEKQHVVLLSIFPCGFL